MANLHWARSKAGGAALGAAAAEEFVQALSRRLERVVGDRGVRPSAPSGNGWRWPVRCCAAVDSGRGHHRARTILLITHRLSSVRGADAIHVMKGGRQVELSEWASLRARPEAGRFREWWKSQEVEAPRWSRNPAL